MQTPVLIVGAGPTGLVLALWLAKSGIAFRIVEKNAGPGQASRAMVVQARTLEFYRQMGIADEIIGSGIVMNALHLRKGSREIAGFVFRDIGEDIGPFPLVLSFPQDDHERMLVKLVEEAGGRIEWNTELVQFKDNGANVSATLRKNAEEEVCEFQYVCGCDGAHSIVRQNLGLNFPGGTYEQVFYVTDVRASGLAFNQDVNACITADSFCIAFPVRSGGTFRLVGVIPEELSGKKDLTFDDIRPYVKRQFDADVHTVNWFTTYRVHHRVADHFRIGRVFIAGDAGHIHSPAGGQGMNTGIGDAVNLGWKLAAVIRGKANESILDTYESERIAFARWLVKSTDRLFQGLVGTGPLPFLIRDVVLPYIAPLLLRFETVRRAQFRLVSQIRIRYRSSPLSSGSTGKFRAGDRLPWLKDQDNFASLKSLDWQIHVYGVPTDGLTAFAASRGLPVHLFNWSQEARSIGFPQNAAYLIRPDGHVALAEPNQDTGPFDRFYLKWMKP